MLQHRFVKILEIELSTELYLNYPSFFFMKSTSASASLTLEELLEGLYSFNTRLKLVLLSGSH